MKSVAAIIALSCIFFSSPAFASTIPFVDDQLLSIAENIQSENISLDLSDDNKNTASNPVVIFMGTTGEIFYLMNNQLQGYNLKNETLTPALNPMQININ